MHYFLAHQGGWDELLWFAVPILIVLSGVRWAERRARRRQSSTEEPSAEGVSMPGDTEA